MRAETGGMPSGVPHRRRIATAVGAARAAGALVYAVAVAVQLVHSIGFWSAQAGADIPFLVLGFFSYFTMQTGSAAAVLLGIGAWLMLSRSRAPRWFVAARALLVTYAVTTALAHAVLLRPIEVDDGSSVPWSDEWLHLVGPVYLLLDWVFASDRQPLRWRIVWIAAIYPVAWAAYTFARGPGALDTRTDTNWYPYPFLNPDTSPGGYASALGYVGVLATVVLAVAALIVLLSRYGRGDLGRGDLEERA